MNRYNNWKFDIDDTILAKTDIGNIIENTMTDIIRDICNQCFLDVTIFTSSLRMFCLRSSRSFIYEEALSELECVLRDKLVNRDESLLNIDTKILNADGVNSVSFDNATNEHSAEEVLYRFHVFSSFTVFDNNNDCLLVRNLSYVIDNFLCYAHAYRALCDMTSPLFLLGASVNGCGTYIDVIRYIKEYHERVNEKYPNYYL